MPFYRLSRRTDTALLSESEDWQPTVSCSPACLLLLYSVCSLLLLYPLMQPNLYQRPAVNADLFPDLVNLVNQRFRYVQCKAYLFPMTYYLRLRHVYAVM